MKEPGMGFVKKIKNPLNLFITMLLAFCVTFSIVLSASAAEVHQSNSKAPSMYSEGTVQLIQRTISDLTAEGKVYQPAVDEELAERVEEASGLSLGAVKTALLFDLFSNYDEGQIDTADLGLDSTTLESVLNMTLKEFALDSAVDEYSIETNDEGIATKITFHMRDSFQSGLGELSATSDKDALAATAVVPHEAKLAQKEEPVRAMAASADSAEPVAAAAATELGKPVFYWVAAEEGAEIPWECWAVFVDKDGNLEHIGKCEVTAVTPSSPPEPEEVTPAESEGEATTYYTASYTVMNNDGTETSYNDEFTPLPSHECNFSGDCVYYWTPIKDVAGKIIGYDDCTAFSKCQNEKCRAYQKIDLTVTAVEKPATATEDGSVKYNATGSDGNIVDTKEVPIPAGITWEAQFNWNHRYVADPTQGPPEQQVGLVYRDGEIQAAARDENGYPLTKIEYYLESIKLVPYKNNEPAYDADTVTINAEGKKTTETNEAGNVTTTTYSNGLTVTDTFIDDAYLLAIKIEYDDIVSRYGYDDSHAQNLGLQLQTLAPLIYCHILTASFDNIVYPSKDGTEYTDTVNATEKAVYQYYNELCAFNAGFPKHFGIPAEFWTSKDKEDDANGAPILGALRTLCNMQPDTFIPFGSNIQEGIPGLDFLISMLTQAFMAYEYQLGPLLDQKISDCAEQIGPNMTTLQKLLAVHDWLANNGEFDMGSLIAMKDGSSGGADPSQMTAFGTLLYDMIPNVDGAVCLGYAATYYLLLQEVLKIDTKDADFVMVRWWANIAETSVAGPDSGFGQGMFNETHYFNAVKLKDKWYYIDACYDDIQCEVMTQYRVETDGNISHNYFLFAPTSALNMFDGNIDYFDSRYDGVIYQRRPVCDENGYQVYDENLQPVYETDEDDHVIWYHSTYPEAAKDAEDAKKYLDADMDSECTETAYDDNQYEESWFTAAMGEIHNDGTYYYYSSLGTLNSYAAFMKTNDSNGGDFDWGSIIGGGNLPGGGSLPGGNSDIEVDLGEVFDNDDPTFKDRLVRRKMSDPVNATQDAANKTKWKRVVEFEYKQNGESKTGTRDVFVDPYTDTIFHYGFGTLGAPKLDEEYKPFVGDDGNYINKINNKPLPAKYGDLVENDALYMGMYPDLAHTSGMYNGKLYFNVANRIYTVDIADATSDWNYDIDLLKEYNEVYYYSDGNRFTGRSFHLTSESGPEATEAEIRTMSDKPIAAISLENRLQLKFDENGNPAGIEEPLILTVSVGTNLSETQFDSNKENYRVEAINYNPTYINPLYIKDFAVDATNPNVEFMWCANLVEDISMNDITLDQAGGTATKEVVVEPTCISDGFTEQRAVKTGISIPDTRVVKEGGALGHDYEWDDLEKAWICQRCKHCDAKTHHPHDNIEEVEFIWAVNENGELSCVVRATCACHGAGSVMTEMPDKIDAIITKEPTVYEPGEKTFTAIWTYNGRTYEGSHTEPVPPIGNVLTITAPTLTTQTGNTFEVPITLSHVYGVTKVAFTVTYNAAVLEFLPDDYTVGDDPFHWKVGEVSSVVENSDGTENPGVGTIKVKLIADGVGQTAPVSTPRLITLKFKSLAGGQSDLAISDFSVLPEQEETESVNGTVTVSAFLRGDVNGDGYITADDMQRIYEHLNGSNPFSDAELIKADVNGDGYVTADDMQRIYEHLNGSNPLP